ncbi:MAG: hypothetical protein C0482_04970 [Gordonia sp.]|nr:hypothetical protein [Gordonia sp. (in: high G+C Gram-positive bacteria)]
MGQSAAAKKRIAQRREEDKQYGPWEPVPDSMRYIEIARAPLALVYEQTRMRVHKKTGDWTIKSREYTGAIHPVPLKFAPPLQDFATDPHAFKYHWERLTYLFELQDPARFPVLEIDETDTVTLARFVNHCRQLAGYSAVNDGGGITYKRDRGRDDWQILADFPSHEAFTGLSGTFRQLHHEKEKASFSIVARILEKATKHLSEPAEARDVLKQWAAVHHHLNEKMVSTMICERLQEGAKAKKPPVSLKGIKPAEMIEAHNYGDSLHWGSKREELAELQNDELAETFHKNCCISAMIQLSHFYFGFAVLTSSTLGEPIT